MGTYYQTDMDGGYSYTVTDTQFRKQLANSTSSAGTVTASAPALAPIGYRGYWAGAGEGTLNWQTAPNFQSQFDVQSASSDIFYNSRWQRVDPSVSTLVTVGPTVTNQSGTGLKVFSSAWTGVNGSGSRASGDSLVATLGVGNNNMMFTQELTLRVNTADSRVIVPWDVASTGQAHGSGLGSGQVVVPEPKFELFTDDFDRALVIPDEKWPSTTRVDFIDGACVFTTNGFNHAIIDTSSYNNPPIEQSYAVRGSHLYAHFIGPLQKDSSSLETDAALSMAVHDGLDESESEALFDFEARRVGTTITFTWLAEGFTVTDHEFTASFSYTNEFWLRLREDSGFVYGEVSTDFTSWDLALTFEPSTQAGEDLLDAGWTYVWVGANTRTISLLSVNIPPASDAELGQAHGSGVGLGAVSGFVALVVGSAFGSGEGSGQIDLFIPVLGSVHGSGVGEGLAQGIHVAIGTAIGSGSGSGQVSALEAVVIGVAAAFGIGLGTASGSIAGSESEPISLLTSAAGGTAVGDTVSATGVLAGTDIRYFAFVTIRATRTVTSVSGGGLTWSLVGTVCHAREQVSSELWTAFGTHSGTFTVDAVFDASANGSAMVVVGYEHSDGAVSDFVRSNTVGTNGACSGGVDDDTATINISVTTASGARAVLFTGPRPRAITTFDPSYTYINDAQAPDPASGGDAVRAYSQDRAFPPAGPHTATNILANTADWAMAAVVIHGGPDPSEPGDEDTDAEPVSHGIWVTKEELDEQPTSGSNWTGSGEVLNTAGAVWDLSDGIEISNSEAPHDIWAAALAFARLWPDASAEAYRTKAAAGIQEVIDDWPVAPDASGTFAARQAGLMVLSADLLNLQGYSATRYSNFMTWMNEVMTREWTTGSIDTIIQGALTRPNNVGGHARFSSYVWAIYNDDANLKSDIEAYMRRWLGDTSFSDTGFSWDSNQTWQENPSTQSTWVGIVAKDAVRDGHVFDGIQPEDQRRGTPAEYDSGDFPNTYIDRYVESNLGSSLCVVELFRRHGNSDAPSWSDSAILRSAQRIKFFADNFAGKSYVYFDTSHEATRPLVEYMYSAGLPTSRARTQFGGRVDHISFTYFTHEGRTAGPDVFTGTAVGSGVGSGSASGFVSTVVGEATGSSVGSGSAQGLVLLFREASGSGVGTGSASGVVVIFFGQAQGSSVGSGTVSGHAIQEQSAAGSGIGLGSASGVETLTLGAAAGSGVGTGSASASATGEGALLGTGRGTGTASGIIALVFGQINGSGVGSGAAFGFVSDIAGQAMGSGVGTSQSSGIKIAVTPLSLTVFPISPTQLRSEWESGEDRFILRREEWAGAGDPP